MAALGGGLIIMSEVPLYERCVDTSPTQLQCFHPKFLPKADPPPRNFPPERTECPETIYHSCPSVTTKKEKMVHVSYRVFRFEKLWLEQWGEEWLEQYRKDKPGLSRLVV